MNKSELDKEFTENYEKFVTVALGVCIKRRRVYSPEGCVSMLYEHLLKKVETLDKRQGIYRYSVKWLRQSIAWARSEINLQEIKTYEYFDRPVEIEERNGSAIDQLKERINEEKNNVADRVSFLFLKDLAGDKDYTKKTIAQYYGLSSRSVEVLIRAARAELNSNQ